MAYGIVHHFPGGTKEQYEATLAVVHPGDGLPEGQTFHAAGPSADGWTVVAVHDSRQSWEQFRDGILMPRMQAGIKVASLRTTGARLRGPQPEPQQPANDLPQKAWLRELAEGLLPARDRPRTCRRRLA